MDKFFANKNTDSRAIAKALSSGKHVVYSDSPKYFDFIEYVKDGKTFADKEYEKWLAEREQAKNAAKLAALLNVQEDQLCGF